MYPLYIYSSIVLLLLLLERERRERREREKRNTRREKIELCQNIELKNPKVFKSNSETPQVPPSPHCVSERLREVRNPHRIIIILFGPL